MTVVKSPLLSFMPCVIVNGVKFLHLIDFFLDIFELFINVTKFRSFPPTNIMLSVRYRMHKGMHGKEEEEKKLLVQALITLKSIFKSIGIMNT